MTGAIMKRLMAAASAVGLLAAFGCSLIDPYHPGLASGIYKQQIFDCKAPSRAKNNNGGGAQFAVGYEALHCAMSAATDVQVKYLKAAGEHETARTIAGIGITGAAAYGIILNDAPGIAAANSSEQITAIAAASAGVFAITNLITSPRRQDAYTLGAMAAACAQLASSPFLVEKKQYDSLEKIMSDNDARSLSSAIASIASLVEALKLLNAKASPPDPAITAYVQGLENELAAARAALARGYALKSEIDSAAPARLRAALARTNTAVAGELRKSQFNLSFLLGASADLSAMAKRLSPASGSSAPAPTPTPAPTTSGGNKTLLNATTNTFSIAAALPGAAPGTTPASLQQSAFEAIRKGVAEINGLADAIEQRVGAVGDIKLCRFEPATLALRLNPETLSFKKGETGSKAFVVDQGESPFVAQLVGSTKGLKVEFSPPFGRVGVVTSDGGADKGEHSVVVMEKSGATKLLKVMIGDSGGPGASGGAPACPAGLKGDEVAEIGSDCNKAKTLQKRLCIKDDGNFGKDTRAAIIRFHEDQKAGNSDSLAKTEINDLTGAATTDCDTTKYKSWYEQKLGNTKLNKIVTAIDSSLSWGDPGVRNYIQGKKLNGKLPRAGDGVVTRELCEAVIDPDSACDP